MPTLDLAAVGRLAVLMVPASHDFIVPELGEMLILVRFIETTRKIPISMMLVQFVVGNFAQKSETVQKLKDQVW